MPKEQKITVNQEDVTRNGHTVSVLTLGKNEIGYVAPEEDGKHFNAFLAGDAKPHRQKTMDAAVAFLLSEYHLHQG
ncbi:DUF2969 family protein [Lacticaseibacillus camelliae]|uniref:DUF2969 domain-containing protein n=1 Tax=Lacticaseibacillus camelliae DSM 22697 = JCM 13995 TaxID=1423730 RepID=A0A0R2FGH5_9LACO|nr:DUF2969 family protein [Lacticaseibacillus camelliae]KRN25093.1 hypothetical protein FC75_GL001006 [Lacticaseibacillus camelliae DSM 22697 = JCM 13995]